MIWESAYWKEDLFRQAADLKRRKEQIRWSERSLALLEKTIMIGFYSIRKLLEAKRVSDSIRDSNLPVMSFRPTGKRVTFMNWHRADELYFLDQPRNEQIALSRLANVFIHSFSFLPVHNEAGFLDAIMVNSDRTRKHGLWCVSIDAIIDLFSIVASDDPSRATMTFNESSGDYDVSLS
jgi:hypothetical protein